MTLNVIPSHVCNRVRSIMEELIDYSKTSGIRKSLHSGN